MKTIFKKFLILSTIILCLSLTSCSKNTIDDKNIVVGASPLPHSEILNECKEYIKSKGYNLVVKKFTDYITPNLALEEGELDANYFQHLPYLEDFNQKKGTHLVAAYKVHYEPLGLYAGKTKSLDNIPDGAKIAIPNDPTNRARAILLLEDLGIITLKEVANKMEVTAKDILDNPHNIQIMEFTAISIPAQLPEVAFGVINGNYAESFNVSEDLRIAQEDKDSVGSKLYGNVIAVREGTENSEAIKVLIEALSQEKIKTFITNKYNGTVLPY